MEYSVREYGVPILYELCYTPYICMIYYHQSCLWVQRSIEFDGILYPLDTEDTDSVTYSNILRINALILCPGTEYSTLSWTLIHVQ